MSKNTSVDRSAPKSTIVDVETGEKLRSIGPSSSKDKNVPPPAPTAPAVGQTDAGRVMTAVTAIQAALAGLSNREARDALTMVASLRNLRVVSMDRPIGNNQSGAPSTKAPGQQSEARSKGPTPPAGWKQNPQWLAANADHAQRVSELKTIEDEDLKSRRLTELRQLESDMKTLKQQLQGSSTI